MSAGQRGWANADKTGGGGDANVLKLGDNTRIRILDIEPTKWRQHIVENADDAEQVEFIVCPGGGNCPLCRKPEDEEGNRRFPTQRRFATNVWDYESGSVKVFIGGPQIFDEFTAAAKVGHDPMASDWVIHKFGSGRSTTYKTVRSDATPFDKQLSADDMIDLSKYSIPKAIEWILETIEKMGYDYDALTVPSFDEATGLEFVMPYGKMKGLTVEQILAQDSQYADWIYNQKKSAGEYGNPVFLAFHAVLEARGEVAAIPEISSDGPTYHQQAPAEEPGPAAVPAAEVDAARAESAITMVKLRGPDGVEIDVPAQAAGSLVVAGYEIVVEDAEPEPEAPEAEPELPLSTVATVKIGDTSLPMTLEAAIAASKAGTELVITDNDRAERQRLAATQTIQPPAEADLHKAAAAEADGGEQIEKPDTDTAGDKPFKCEFCERAFKSKGGLTQHRNREHADADPAPAAANGNGAKAEGGEDREVVLERVKTAVAAKPDLMKDHQALIALFMDVAQKRNISDFDTAELLALEQRLLEK